MSDFLKWIIGFILWFFLSFGMYKACNPCCDKMWLCGHTHTTTALTPPPVAPPPTPKEPIEEPLTINCNWPATSSSEAFLEYKAQLLNEADSDAILEITGLYSEGEENTSSFDNLGLERANRVKELFTNEIPSERILLTARNITSKDQLSTNFFSCAELNWTKEAASSEPKTIETFDDKTIIRFPYNSVVKDVDPTVDAFLSELAEQLKTSGNKVTLTGHTDNYGSAERNEILADRRAKMIRDILRRKGVKRSQITTISKGETEPISSNETEIGRHNNRRVVVRVHE